uniref:Uncharacterized protein n=1 Tax=Castor canadensis TaxID=51338 RepID=A0A8C0WJF1_CASCN
MGGAEAWAPSSIFWNLVPGLLYPHSLSALSHLFSVVHSKTTPVGTSQLKNPQELHGREQVQPWKMQAKLRLMRSMLRTQRTSLQELSNHERFLIKLNEELIEAIRCMEDSTALTVRTMVQQHYVLGNVIDILEYSNKKRVQELKTELLEWEELEKLKLKRLEQQLEQLHAENKMTHEEARFLSTYMDHEYPVKSVQIASHMRQLQQAKDDQKDELDNLSEMRKVVLGSLSNMIQEKKKKAVVGFPGPASASLSSLSMPTRYCCPGRGTQGTDLSFFHRKPRNLMRSVFCRRLRIATKSC